MKRLLASLLLPVFLTPLTIISTEQELVLSKSEQFELLANTSYFTALPENPRLYRDTPVYLDKTLTRVGQVLSADQPLQIEGLVINDQLVPVFELKSGGFLPASQLLIFDDQELSREAYEAKVWVKEGAKVYDRPLIFGAKALKPAVTAFEEAKVKQVARTYSGTYYYLEGKGWVDRQAVYEDPMAAVQALLLSKYKKDNIGVYVQRLDDDQVAGVNQDTIMYGASVSKLATIYKVQDQLDQGKVKLTDKFKYTKDVMGYKGFYDPEGAGIISKEPDDKDYTLEDLLKALTKHSDNVASNMLGYYVADKFNRNFQLELAYLLGRDWDLIERDLSAETAGLMMAELYRQDGLVLDYLSETAYDDQRISKDISVKVAHKVGDADDFRHDVAIVYADRPFVLSVFTEKASYEDITAIANDVYKILK